MPRRKAPEKPAKKARPTRPQGDVQTFTFQIKAHPPGNVSSQYANLTTMQYRAGEEVTLNFWQVCGLAVDIEKQEAEATLLGTYVLRPSVAEQLLDMLAGNLGYEIVPKEAQDGG